MRVQTHAKMRTQVPLAEPLRTPRGKHTPILRTIALNHAWNWQYPVSSCVDSIWKYPWNFDSKL